MRTLRYLIVFLFLASLLTAAPTFRSSCVGIYDLDQERYLLSHRVHTKRAPASTIKLLTALTVVSNVRDLDQYFRASKRAQSMPNVKAGVHAGEEYKVSDLLSAILIASCNDAAVILAEGVAGSESEFAKLMLEQARVVGADNTKPTNASGLPEPAGMVSTVDDLRKILTATLEVPLLREILKKEHFTLKSRDGKRSFRLHSHNRLLDHSPYPVTGKTGYTRKARHCFASQASHDDRNVMVILLGAPSRATLWKEVKQAYGYGLSPESNYLPSYMRTREISVEELHRELKKHDCAPHAEEKHYGPLTRDAVKRFQEKKGLSVDGIAGPNTWKHLREESQDH